MDLCIYILIDHFYVLQASSLRTAAKDLARSAFTDTGSDVGASVLDPVPPCPAAMWVAVAPSLMPEIMPPPSGANATRDSLTAPCAGRAERVRLLLEQAIDLKPDLEASKARADELVSPYSDGEQLLVIGTQGNNRYWALFY